MHRQDHPDADDDNDDNPSSYHNDGDAILFVNTDEASVSTNNTGFGHPASPAPSVSMAMAAGDEEIVVIAPAPLAEPVPILVSSADQLDLSSPSTGRRRVSEVISVINNNMNKTPPFGARDGDGEPANVRDPVTSVIGDFGKWQMKVATLASIAAVFTAWSTLSIAFLAPETGHWCAKPEEFANLTDQQWKDMAIPVVTTEKGTTVFSSCEMYKLDSLHLPPDDRDQVRCPSWDFDQSDFGETITSKWALVCGREWIISTGQSIFMAGKFLGCAVFGLFSDRFGRKTTLLVCAGMKLGFGVYAAFAPNLWVFVCLHFLVAMSSSGMYTAGFVMVMEVIGGKWRSTFGLAFCYPFSIGYIMLSVMAWRLRDWWKLQLSISLPTVVFFAFYWILPESPRWLLSRHRYAEAEAILCDARKANGMDRSRDGGHNKYAVSKNGGDQPMVLLSSHETSRSDNGIHHNAGTQQVGSMNGVTTVAVTDASNGQVLVRASLPADEYYNDGHAVDAAGRIEQQHYAMDQPSLPGKWKADASSSSCSVVAAAGLVHRHSSPQHHQQQEHQRGKQGGPVDLMRKGYMRRRMLNVFLCWFVNAFVYYGLSLNATNLGGNVFLNFGLSGAIEIPAYTLSILFLLKFSGRRMLISITMVTGGIACVLIPIVPINHFPNDWPVTALATIGKFGISASYAIIYVFTAELIPTIVRTAGVGISSTFARIGSIFAPFVLLLGNKQTGDFTYPMLICGALAIVSGSLVWMLPETSTNPMPETFEQARQQTRKAQRLRKKQLLQPSAAGDVL